MRIVVIGGTGRNVGKTSVATGLIRSLRHLDWMAVKISTHPPSAPHGNARGFALTEETTESGSTDTGRFLAAGARRAFWLRTTPESLGAALASLIPALRGAEHVLIESGRALDWICPRIGIVVRDSSRRATKPQRARKLSRTDAVVEMSSEARAQSSGRIRVFEWTRTSAASPALARFVRAALRKMSDSQIREPRKE